MLAIASIASFSSCSKKKGPSEESKQLMSTFETDWKALGDQMTAWESTLNSSTDAMAKMMVETRAIDLSKLSAESKTMAEMNLMMCGKIDEQIVAAKTSFAAAKTEFAKATDEYTAWKKKGQEEHMDDATIATEMANWNAKLTEWKTKVGDMNAQLAGMEDTCKQTCDAIAALVPVK